MSNTAVPAASAPIVSVIVPCYNHERYVAQCLNSILAQDYSNIQLIVIDDGSRDGSVGIIRELADRHGFMFIAQQNRGLIPTINLGLSHAAGEYYCVFASDDWMLPGRMTRQVSFMQTNPQFVACGGNCVAVDETGSQYPQQKILPYRELHFDDIFLHQQPGIPAPTAMVRTAPVKQLGGYREDAGIEDTWLWLTLTQQGMSIAVLDDVFACYRHHPDSMHARLGFMVDSMLRIYDDYRAHPQYQWVVNRFLLGMFARAAKQDKPLAFRIRSLYRGSRMSRKYLKGLWRLYT